MNYNIYIPVAIIAALFAGVLSQDTASDVTTIRNLSGTCPCWDEIDLSALDAALMDEEPDGYQLSCGKASSGYIRISFLGNGFVKWFFAAEASSTTNFCRLENRGFQHRSGITIQEAEACRDQLRARTKDFEPEQGRINSMPLPFLTKDRLLTCENV